MKAMTCAHPVRMINIMRDFAESINLTCDCSSYYQYVDNKLVAGGTNEPIQYHFHKALHGGFGVDTDEIDKGWRECFIYYDIEQLFTEHDFRAFWQKRNPVLRGFADITITLLHELGHVATRNETFIDYDGSQYDRDEAMAFLRFLPMEIAIECYFDLPDERAATEWAIKWLNDPEHRKIAKAFEKKFFACFK